MSSPVFKIIVFLALVFSCTCKAISPTENYLNVHSLDQIRSRYTWLGFDEYTLFFAKIANQEKNEGFFGYHGCSQRYRLFQDILRALFEESLGFMLPKDFHFLRIPGDPLFNLKDNKQSFYQLFDRKELAEAQRQLIVDELFLKPFNQRFATKLKANKLSQETFKALWELVMHFIETLDLLAIEEYYAFDDADYSQGFPLPDLRKKRSVEGEKQEDDHLESSYRKLTSIIRYLEAEKTSGRLPRELHHSQKAKAQLISLLASEIPRSERANLTSWAAESAQFITFLYRITEAFGGIFSYAENGLLSRFFFPYIDHDPLQQTRLISMNIPIYGNYYRPGECSMSAFLYDSAIANGDAKTLQLLSDFFVKMGFDENLATTLFLLGAEELEYTDKKGCLLQFFDLSANMLQEPYSGADSVAFAAHSFGIPIKLLQPSELIYGIYPLQQNHKDVQLRLVASNHTTLNPYSFLRIRRYDTLAPEISARILNKMKIALRYAPVDKTLLKRQKRKFKKLWKLD